MTHRVVVDQGVQLVVHVGAVPEFVGNRGGSFKRHCSVLPFRVPEVRLPHQCGAAEGHLGTPETMASSASSPVGPLCVHQDGKSLPFHSAGRGAGDSSKCRIIARETHHSVGRGSFRHHATDPDRQMTRLRKSRMVHAKAERVVERS